MTKRWLTVLSEAELAAGARQLVTVEGRKIALFRPTDAELYAVDNQCPHEGYPLLKGDLCGTTLTCCYHNYKFDLRDGACLKGEERVQSYETRIADGEIEIAIETVDATARNARHLHSLHEGLHHRRLGQVAREIVRLLQWGLPAEVLALELAAHDAAHGEYGAGHGLAVAADALVLMEGASTHEAALILMQAADMVADSTVRLPERALPAALKPQHEVLMDALDDAIEREDSARAIGHVLYALAHDQEPTVRRAALRACARHFLGFGHGLIYITKVAAFVRALPYDAPERLWPGVIDCIINQTREDLLPEWAWFRDALTDAGERLHVWPREVLDSSPDSLDELYRDILDGPRETAFLSVLDALQSGVGPDRIVSCVSLAASERIRRFDVTIDGSDEVQEGFLDVTHALTFAVALRESLSSFDLDASDDREDIARLLLQAARFVNNAKRLDDPCRLKTSERPSHATRGQDDPTPLAAALREGSETRAFEALAALNDASQHPVVGTAERTCHAVTFEDHATRPILVAHLIKTARAAFAESRVLFESDALPVSSGGHLSPLAAYAHLATSRVRERWIGRFVHEAERFVIDGKVPRTLT